MATWKVLGIAMIAGCEVQQPESEFCEPAFDVSGTVGDGSVRSPDYVVGAAWWYYPGGTIDVPEPSAEEKAALEQIGLDPADAGDLDRFAWLLNGWDLYVSFTAFDGLGMNQRYEAFYLGFDEYDVQPGATAEVLNFGELADALQVGDRDEVRAAIDAVKDLDAPRVGVAYSAEPTEGLGIYAYLFNSLLDPGASWATTGDARLDGVLDREGAEIGTLSYPTKDVDSVSVSGSPVFDGQSTAFEASCVLAEIRQPD